ncbi:MAG: nucleotidyl transferase AbiEii/AbiGii toxin family protein [Bacteroidetes bacterium]|nr:nucleotidyl transferase AbiEii/AbiGii toxin family protein [Bacteroidota bacterium]
MQAEEFKSFRLVGGTALSLYRGHRKSIDIDLFTDVEYGSVDFNQITTFLKKQYSYVDTSKDHLIGFGKSYFVGNNNMDSIKLDVFYTDTFMQNALLIDGIRLTSIEDIIAMKLDVISRGGRKKDFWDIHELMNDYTVQTMFNLHRKKHPYTHHTQELKEKFCDFSNAEDDFEPVCFKGKHWQLIKMDLIDFVSKLSRY